MHIDIDGVLLSDDRLMIFDIINKCAQLCDVTFVICFPCSFDYVLFGLTPIQNTSEIVVLQSTCCITFIYTFK